MHSKRLTSPIYLLSFDICTSLQYKTRSGGEQSAQEMQNLAALQESSRYFGRLATSEASEPAADAADTQQKAFWGIPAVDQSGAHWAGFWRTASPGWRSYFTMLDIESIWANRITPYWIYNCWQPMTLHLIGYWTADTPALSQLIQVWMHNLDSQSYYNLLNAAALPANLVTTYWSVNKESHITSSWIGTRENEWEPIAPRLIVYVGASRPGRGFTSQRGVQELFRTICKSGNIVFAFIWYHWPLTIWAKPGLHTDLSFPSISPVGLSGAGKKKRRIKKLACSFMGVSCHICRSSKHTTWAY